MHLHYRPTEETQRERKEYETLSFSTRSLKLFFFVGGVGGWGRWGQFFHFTTSNCEDCKNKYMIENKAGKVKVVKLNVRDQSLKLYLITNNHIYGSCFRKIITIQELEEKSTI